MQQEFIAQPDETPRTATPNASVPVFHTPPAEEQTGEARQAETLQYAVLTPAQTRQASEFELETLVRRFQQTGRLHRLRVRRAIWMGVGSAFALMVVNTVALIVLLQTERFAFAPMWWLWIVNALVFAACLLYPARSARARRASAMRLAGYEDVRVVGPLTELLTASDPLLRHTARRGLIRLLPLLTARDAHWLNEEQRDRLCEALADAERQPELCKAILKAFGQIGDSSMIGLVQRIGDIRARVSSHKELRDTARAVLPLLRARIQHESARQTLLRPGEVEPTDPATLLRVPASVQAPPSQELLRPAKRQAETE